MWRGLHLPRMSADLPTLLARAHAKGPDSAFRAWVQRQPSCISGRFSEWVNGEGRNPACHVRRARESGTAYKGEYACVPLTQPEHLLTHQRGESHFHPKEWWDAQRLEYLRRWIETQ